MDQIRIGDLSLRCIIGTRPAERRMRQEVVVNIALDCDLSRAGRTDRPGDTIDFDGLEKRIVRLVEGSRFRLIERLADRIAAACLRDSKVLGATVAVDKPRALRFARSAGVEVFRARPRAGASGRPRARRAEHPR